jgi:AraC-like DNA-binding protein
MEQSYTKTKHCELVYKGYGNTDNELHVINHGALFLCQKGTAIFTVNFSQWEICEGKVATFFPGEAVTWKEMSEDFQGIVLRYDSEILREASIQLEYAVYSFLRSDCLIPKEELVNQVIKSIFQKMFFYFNEPDCQCIDTIVILELKSFFIGLNDYLQRHPDKHKLPLKSQRTNELFNHFMEIVEHNYKESHNVQYYADQLFITRKYLNTISIKRTGLSPKKIIDEYIILQIKLTLHSTNKSIKEIASEFHFSDFSLFVRYFKANTGMTPLKYRQGKKTHYEEFSSQHE